MKASPLLKILVPRTAQPDNDSTINLGNGSGNKTNKESLPIDIEIYTLESLISIYSLFDMKGSCMPSSDHENLTYIYILGSCLLLRTELQTLDRNILQNVFNMVSMR